MAWVKLDTHWYADERFEQLGERFGPMAFAVPVLLGSVAGPTSGVRITPERLSQISRIPDLEKIREIVQSAIDVGLLRPLRYHEPNRFHLSADFCRTRNLRSVSKKQRERIIHRDRGTCQICGRIVERDEVLEIDHIQPVSKGGTDDDSNLQVAHFACNRAKAAR